MKAKWIICNLGKDADIQNLGYAVQESGRDAEIISLKDMSEMLDTFNDEKACVVTSGSIWLNGYIRKQRPNWIGNWYNPQLFTCQRYYAYWGKYITQRKYTMLPLAEVFRQKERLYAEYASVDGSRRSLFIRPDSGEKEFAGEVIDYDRFNGWKDAFIDPCDLSPDLLCVVSYPVEIEKEMRLVMQKGKVVTGSTYRIHKHILQEPLEELPDRTEIIAFAERVCSDNPPPLPPICVLDIAVHEDGYSIMEVGCYGCAGLYKCDRRKVAIAVSEAAEEEYALSIQ